MKKVFLFISLAFLSCQLMGQTNWKNFWKQPTPIKKWIVFHPFKASKALKVSERSNRVSDSIALTNLLDKDKSGGQVDAFRHAYWMARLHEKIGKRAALSLGRSYERSNYKTYKRNRLENGTLPDKVSKSMDLFNNRMGVTYTKKGFNHPENGLIYKIVNSIKKGELKILKKDKAGNYLTCNNQIILPEDLWFKWRNNKCLIPSNN